MMKSLFAAAAALTILATPVSAQDMPRQVVSIYHVAPGQQVNFLKWVARQDAVAAAAGLKPGALYVHTDGDSWDYIVIAEVTTDAQDKAIEEAAKKMGVDVRKGGLDLRRYINSHTDTYTIGPVTAADYLKSVGE